MRLLACSSLAPMACEFAASTRCVRLHHFLTSMCAFSQISVLAAAAEPKAIGASWRCVQRWLVMVPIPGAMFLTFLSKNGEARRAS